LSNKNPKRKRKKSTNRHYKIEHAWQCLIKYIQKNVYVCHTKMERKKSSKYTISFSFKVLYICRLASFHDDMNHWILNNIKWTHMIPFINAKSWCWSRKIRENKNSYGWGFNTCTIHNHIYNLKKKYKLR
jgi:hypothetical protein